MHPTSRSNQPTFKVYNVKGYKYIGTYSIEVEFSNGDKETFYSIYRNRDRRAKKIKKT